MIAKGLRKAPMGLREEEQHRRETLEKYRHSPCIKEVEGWPESEAKDSYLRDLERLKDVIHSKKLGYGSYSMSMIYRKLKDIYPQAHVAFERELGLRSRVCLVTPR